MDVIEWLLEGDPAIRWQVLRDLTDAPPDEVAAERARVATEGWGAQLLRLQGTNGLWDEGVYRPGQRATTRVTIRGSRGQRPTGSCSTCATWACSRAVR